MKFISPTAAGNSTCLLLCKFLERVHCECDCQAECVSSVNERNMQTCRNILSQGNTEKLVYIVLLPGWTTVICYYQDFLKTP